MQQLNSLRMGSNTGVVIKEHRRESKSDRDHAMTARLAVYGNGVVKHIRVMYRSRNRCKYQNAPSRFKNKNSP
jgi:hypothetical protein